MIHRCIPYFISGGSSHSTIAFRIIISQRIHLLYCEWVTLTHINISFKGIIDLLYCEESVHNVSLGSTKHQNTNNILWNIYYIISMLHIESLRHPIIHLTAEIQNQSLYYKWIKFNSYQDNIQGIKRLIHHEKSVHNFSLGSNEASKY
jgi:hypothetical protein